MKYKILIADDDENVRIPVQRAFADHIVLSAGDGQAAVRIIRDERPSVVLLDINMPLMNGLEVLGEFKDAADAPPFIMLTGNEELEMASKALEMGASSYITKPFDVDALRRVVLAALEDGKDGEKASDKPWHTNKDGK